MHTNREGNWADHERYNKPLKNTDTQTDGPTTQIFDISMEDKKEEFARDLDMATTQDEEREQAHKRNRATLTEGHLGQPEPPWVEAFIEQGGVIQSASSSSNQPMQINNEGEQQKRSPEDTHETRGKPGRPRKTQRHLCGGTNGTYAFTRHGRR